MSLCLASQVWPGRVVLVPIPGPEQPHSSPTGARGADERLRALTSLGGLLWRPARAFVAPKISQSLGGAGIALWHSPHR